MQSPEINPISIKMEQATKLFDDHLNDAIRIARSYSRKNRDIFSDNLDLVNHAIIGLIGAINRYNPRLSKNFRSYARIRVRGAVLDRLRAIDPLSRTERRMLIAMNKAETRLTKLLGRAPTTDEIAIELSVTPDKLRNCRSQATPPTVSLQQGDLIAGRVHDTFNLSGSDPLASIMNAQNLAILKNGVATLSEKQRMCIELSFYENLPLTRIAELLGLTLSRVSQIRNEALAKLGGYLRKFQ